MSTKGTKTETKKEGPAVTKNLTPSEIAEQVNLETPDNLFAGFDNTGGGVMCITVTPDPYEDEIALYFGTAEGFLGWSDYFGEADGSWSQLVASDEDYRAWQDDEPISQSAEIVAKIVETVKSYFGTDPEDLTDPDTIVTCADRAITLIDVSEISDVLSEVQNLDQLTDRVDWNHFLAEGCDHVTFCDSNGEGGNFGSDEMIAHLNAVNVAADLMIQGTEPVLDHLYNYLKLEQVARGPHCATCDKVKSDHASADHPFASATHHGAWCDEDDQPTCETCEEDLGHPFESEVYAAVHAQIEDLTPPEALEILDKIRADLKSEIRNFAG